MNLLTEETRKKKIIQLFLSETIDVWISYGNHVIAITGNCCHLQRLKHQTHSLTLVKESLPRYCMSAACNCKRHQLPLENPKHGTRNKWDLSFRASHLPTAFSCGTEKVTCRFDPNSCFLGICQSLGKNSQSVGTSISNQDPWKQS